VLTQKLIAAVGLAGALLMGVSADAAANPWRVVQERCSVDGVAYQVIPADGD